MRILLVSAHGADTSYGGAERYVFDLARGLRDRGHEPTVLSAFPPGRAPAGIEVVVLHDSDWRTSEIRRLRNHLGDLVAMPTPRVLRAVDAARPDLIHTNNLPGISTAVWAVARRRSTPVVHTLHDYYLLCPRTTLTRRDGRTCHPHPLLCGFRQRRLGRFAGAVAEIVAGSEHVLRVHRALFPDARGSVIRLPLVPLAEAPPPPREPPQAIGFIGGLASIKGVGALLDAAPGLAAMGITLRVAGDGPLRPEIEAAAGRGSLVYDGFVDGAEKAAFVAGCDVGIVPSQWDEPSGPPYVVCEWLAASRPVLASARGGLGEVAAKVGAVVAIEPSPEGIVTGAKRLLQPEAWREAVAAIPAAEPRDLARWLDEHEAIYAAAARRPRAGAVA